MEVELLLTYSACSLRMHKTYTQVLWFMQLCGEIETAELQRIRPLGYKSQVSFQEPGSCEQFRSVSHRRYTVMQALNQTQRFGYQQ